jgi:hypothetical protein
MITDTSATSVTEAGVGDPDPPVATASVSDLERALEAAKVCAAEIDEIEDGRFREVVIYSRRAR